MQNSRKKKLIFILVFIIILVPIGFFIYIFNKPHRNIIDEKAAVNISATNLFSEYEMDEEKADEIYLDKAIAIQGKIGKLNILNEDGPIVVLKKLDDYFGVSCSFNKENGKELADKNLGEFIKVKGICKGYLNDVIIVDCIIIE